MKLTQKQIEVVNKYKELETEYGKGNVFLRWVNDYWKVCFVIHKVGEETYKPFYDYKVNGRVVNSLEEKGLFTGCDINHNENVDPNSWRNKPEVWHFIGSRIKTELLNA